MSVLHKAVTSDLFHDLPNYLVLIYASLRVVGCLTALCLFAMKTWRIHRNTTKDGWNRP